VNTLKVLSIHWGFSLGGVGKYATLLESVEKYAPIQMKSICITGRNWQIDGSNLDKIDIEKITIKSRLDLSWLSKISSFITQYKPALIITHGFNGHFVVFLSNFFNKNKIPVVCSYHGLYHPTTLARRFFGIFFNGLTVFYLRHTAKGIVCVAEYSRRYLISKGIPKNKLTVIHNGIKEKSPDPRNRLALREKWGVQDNELLLGAASRLDPVKGIEFLIDALGIVQNDSPHIKLVIIGTGTLDQQLKRQIEHLELEDHVIFTGYRTDINQCLGAIDIFMLPSLAEYHSIAILEAMRAGTAIIATDVGGNTESVRDRKEALIVPPKNAFKLAEAIKTLASDTVLCQQLGENAKVRFQKEFTVDIMVKKTADWLVKCHEQATNTMGNIP